MHLAGVLFAEFGYRRKKKWPTQTNSALRNRNELAAVAEQPSFSLLNERRNYIRHSTFVLVFCLCVCAEFAALFFPSLLSKYIANEW